MMDDDDVDDDVVINNTSSSSMMDDHNSNSNTTTHTKTTTRTSGRSTRCPERYDSGSYAEFYDSDEVVVDDSDEGSKFSDPEPEPEPEPEEKKKTIPLLRMESPAPRISKDSRKGSNSRGVTMRPSGRWQAQLYYEGKSRYFGVYDDVDSASRAFKIAKDSLFTENYVESKEKDRSMDPFHDDLVEKAKALVRNSMA